MPIVLLMGSNVFMTFAWYGHLKYRDRPLRVVVLISWLIAFLEYCLAAPANRLGIPAPNSRPCTNSSRSVFAIFYLDERITIDHLVGFGFIALGAFFVFKGPL